MVNAMFIVFTAGRLRGKNGPMKMQKRIVPQKATAGQCHQIGSIAIVTGMLSKMPSTQGRCSGFEAGGG